MVKEMSALRKGEHVCLEEVDGEAEYPVLVDSIPEETTCANISKEK